MWHQLRTAKKLTPRSAALKMIVDVPISTAQRTKQVHPLYGITFPKTRKRIGGGNPPLFLTKPAQNDSKRTYFAGSPSLGK